ncbi:hypothetical protein DRO21_06820 [archaeon]|nr:MAG: hypothetical protein DRO21_06820 [archaeon]
MTKNSRINAGKVVPAIILYAMASFADIVTTIIGLQYGFVESNEFAWMIVTQYGWHTLFICDVLYFIVASIALSSFSKFLKSIANGNRNVVKIADNLWIALYIITVVRFTPVIHNLMLLSKAGGNSGG